MNNTFRMIPGSRGVLVVLVVLVLLLVFVLPSAGSGGSGVRIVVGLIPAALILVFAGFLYSSHWTQFELSSQGLQISRTLYGRHVPAQSLKTQEARLMDLTADQDDRSS